MKLIAMTLLIGMMTGAADAADIFDLHGIGPSEVAARTQAVQIPQVPPVFPAAPWNNNWPGAFPQPQHGTIDTCEFTSLADGKCWFKCVSGNVIAEPPLKTDPAGAPADTCATHVFIPVPAAGRKGSRTMENWESVDLLADDGTQISVDYVPVDLGGKVKASHIWVSVRNPGFTGGEAVTARLANYYEATSYSAEALKAEAELPLAYNGWNFQGKFPDLDIFEAHHSWSHSFRQELAVFVNGRRLTDASGAPAFRLKLPGKPAWAEQGKRPGKATRQKRRAPQLADMTQSEWLAFIAEVRLREYDDDHLSDAERQAVLDEWIRRNPADTERLTGYLAIDFVDLVLAFSRAAQTRSREKALRVCSFREMKGDACSYSCSDGSSYSRPMSRPSPFGDEPIVPCPALVFPL